MMFEPGYNFKEQIDVINKNSGCPLVEFKIITFLIKVQSFQFTY